jgi:hypothetical protein
MRMKDPVLEAFLKRQHEEGFALAGQSDMFDLRALDGPPAQHYIATFYCNGLVQERDGSIVQANRFVVGYYFSPSHLRAPDPYQAVMLFQPERSWHPNVRAPYLCLGHIAPATTLVDLIYRSFELLTYRKCTMREDNALNHEACVWARNNQHRFPLDRRPLKRRRGAIGVTERIGNEGV